MKSIATLAVALLATTANANAQEMPMPAERITPAMLSVLEIQYPAAAVECLKESLPKALASDVAYLFTADYQRGQLWLISVQAAMSEIEAMPYICTARGLAKTPQEAMEAMFGGMGLPF